MKKERLDTYLVNLGYFETKSKAAAAILAGDVKINGEVLTKAGSAINIEKKYDIEVKTMPYVSRGGFKLEKAINSFDVSVKDRICLDAGASTGGFTDCLLQNGAKFVYAVDVGYGQFAWKLRTDKRVKVIEKTNLKICLKEDIYSLEEVLADLLVMDVSFISIEKVLPNLKKLLRNDFHEMICLIKPQFEAGKEQVDKGGVVKDRNVHIDVIERVLLFIKTQGYIIKDLTYSSIKGPSGNIEYLVYFSTEGEENIPNIVSLVNEAFVNL